MHLKGNIALVTGGASGLGRATAKHFASQGCKVAVLDRTINNIESLNADGIGLALTADVSDRGAVASAFDQVEETYGSPPRILVNCAGIGTASRILPRDGVLPFEAFEKTLQVNLIGSYITLSIAAQRMTALEPTDEDGSRGVIINTSSLAYQDGQIGQAAYAASKGGIASMTLPAARELARFGIRVMAIAPGLFETAMTAGLPDDARQSISASIPFPSRLGQASEYAELAAQIVRNTMLNGTTIRLDGAVRLQPR
ncbi:SDR family NAD(P)-dependent oxidoreductase [Rhodobacteraceae bacterium RKSG542]|uniref:SDR family NAD(P)-dependent oxidoreductase n=1 Tax=Pseudovibrio flavus TaxID=2529854 RepID=UPI0035288BAA|nr:SDR family NAD(P)-dependent oxidoreductase [Pseudovibrio flavus]